METLTGLRSQSGESVTLGNGKKKKKRFIGIQGVGKHLVTNGVTQRPVSHTVDVQ